MLHACVYILIITRMRVYKHPCFLTRMRDDVKKDYTYVAVFYTYA